MTLKLLFFTFLVFFQTLFSQELAGSWKGDLDVQGMKIPLVLNVKQTEKGYNATLDSPKQNVFGIPVNVFSIKENQLYFEVNNLEAHYKGVVNGKKIEGIFSQSGMQIPLNLEISEKTAPKVTVSALPNDISKQVTKLDEYVKFLDQNNLLAGAISVFKNGKEVYKNTFGQKNLPNYNSENALFQIGSITKTFTAVMIHQLEKEKKISQKELLSTYFPEIPNASKITISQLLNHTSGLADYVKKDEDYYWLRYPAKEKQIFENIVSQKSLFEPGTTSSYSNSGYYLLAKIIEKITGKSYAENLQTRILNPLKLTNTYSVLQHPKGVFGSFSFENGWETVEDFDFKNVIGVGDIAAFPTDLNVFITHLFAGKILNPSTTNTMKPNSTEKFGKGIAKVPFYNKTFLGHSGGTYGTNSLMVYNEEDQLAISYSLNADRIGSNNFAIGVLSMLYDVPYEFPNVKTEKIAESELQKYAGEYTSKDIPLDLKFFVENGVLKAQATGQPSFSLDYKGNHEFTFDQINVKINFYPEKNKLQMNQNGMKFQYQKK